MSARLHKITLGLAASMAILTAIPLAQAGNGKYGSIYAVDPYGTVVRDPYGKCIRTPQWSADKEAPECGGKIAVVQPPPPVHKEITLGAETLFDFDKSNLKPAGQAKLDELVGDLRQVDISSIAVKGYTDSIGTEAYNQRLSERRADTVRSYLVEKGVNSSVVTAQGFGEADPVAPNALPNGKDNPAGRAQNRRVEITVDGTQQVQQ